MRVAWREGIDDFVFSAGIEPVLSLFADVLYDEVVGDVCEGSTEKDLRTANGFGEMTGGGVDELLGGCQRSRTELCRFPEVIPRSGVGEPSVEPSSTALFSTIFLTKPRPFNRLILGVGSFSFGGLRNAGDGFCEGGVCGVPNGVRGAG